METLFGIILCIVGGWICWVSSQILDERKQAYRAGTHDYYGNPIDKENV